MYSIYNDIEDALGSNINKKPILIAANHCEFRDQQDKFDLVPVDQYKNIEDKLKSPVIEVSAKTNVGINQLFENVIRKYFEIHQLDNLNKNETATKEKQPKSRWSIQKNKKKSVPIESQQQTNTLKEEDNKIYNIKVGMFSGGGCGKTRITLRYLKNEFSEGYTPTMDDEFVKIIKVDGKTISLTVIDTADQDDFADTRFYYYSKCKCFILVFTIDNPQSIDELRSIYRDITNAIEYSGNNAPIVIAVNNCELRQEAMDDLVTVEEILKLEDECHVPVIEVSPRCNINIDQLFKEVIRRYFNCINERKDDPNTSKKEKKKSFWSKHFGKKK